MASGWLGVFSALAIVFFAYIGFDVVAVAGLITVVMILLLGMSRILFALSRDRLIPPWLSGVHPRFGTPYRSTVIMGVTVAVLSGFIPLAELATLVNIGTLFAFIVVSVAVVILRRTRPDLPRAFRTPLVPLVPALAVLACLFAMINLPVETWLRFLVRMAAGVVVYAAYGHRRSRLRVEGRASAEPRPAGHRPRAGR